MGPEKKKVLVDNLRAMKNVNIVIVTVPQDFTMLLSSNIDRGM